MKAKVVAGIIIAVLAFGLITLTLSQTRAQNPADSDDLAKFVAIMRYIRSQPTPADVKSANIPVLSSLDTALSDIYITGFITPYTGETPDQVKARLQSVPEEDRFTAVMVESYRLASDDTLLNIIHKLLPLYYVEFFTTAEDLNASAKFLKRDDIESLAATFDSTNYAIPVPSVTGTPQPTPTQQAQPTPTMQPSLTLKYDPAGQDRNCDDFTTWREAQAFFLATQNDSHGLDQDGNGIACENLPGAPQPEVQQVVVTATPTPSPTPIPTGQGMSRYNPQPMDGTCYGPANGFCFGVLSVDWDAWPEIEAENSFNDPPPADHKFVMVEVFVLNQGSVERNSITADSDSEVLGEGTNVAIRSTRCGVIPNDLEWADVYPGGSLSGNICFVVPEEDISTLMLLWEPTFGDKLWFALHPGASQPG